MKTDYSSFLHRNPKTKSYFPSNGSFIGEPCLYINLAHSFGFPPESKKSLLISWKLYIYKIPKLYKRKKNSNACEYVISHALTMVQEWEKATNG